jgi:glycosyltransferase involved in cell wall biosynthesis
MSLPPTFSVIIPTYNRASLVARAIESVLAQTYTNFEIIVIDDGSTDNTGEVVRGFEVAHGERVRYFWQENQGKSVALNNAFPHARGEFIAFLDSDDRWLPEKLEWQFLCIQKFGTECPCFTDAIYVNNPCLQQTAFEYAGRKYEETLGCVSNPKALLLGTRSGIYVQTLVVHRSVIQRVGDFDPKLPIGEDTDYLFRLALGMRFCYVNKPLVEIDRTVNRKDGLVELFVRHECLRLEKREYLYNKWLALTLHLGNGIRKQLLARLAEIHSEWANWHLVNRQYGKARQAMSKSVATSFTAKAAAKLALTTVAPALARREFVKRESERAKHRVIA